MGCRYYVPQVSDPFKTCDTCSIESVPVTSSTKYFIGDREVALAELAEQARSVSQEPGAAEQTLLMVHYDVDTKRATRLILRTFPAR